MSKFLDQVLQTLRLRPTPEQLQRRELLGEYIDNMRKEIDADLLIDWYKKDSARVRVLRRENVEESRYVQVVGGQIKNHFEGYFSPDPKEWDWALAGRSAERK